jgi:hypothetical protein
MVSTPVREQGRALDEPVARHYNRGMSVPLQARRFLVFLVLAGSASFSIIYVTNRIFTPELIEQQGAYRDAEGYLALYFGERLDGLHDTRILVPLLARFAPGPPSGLFLQPSSDPVVDAVRSFGVVNFLFLLVACMGLYFIHQQLGLDYGANLMGIALFLGAKPVLQYAGVPMTEAALWGFTALCALTILCRRPLLLALLFVPAMLANERVLLVGPMVLLSPWAWRTRLMLLFALVPGLCVWVLHWPARGISDVGTILLEDFVNRTASYLSVSGIGQTFLAFGLSWLLFAVALRYCTLPPVLQRWAWIVPVFTIAIMAYQTPGNTNRIVFGIFPVVIPIASLGLAKLLRP